MNKLTCLHERHCGLGAQMSPFAGYDMPIEYEGLDAEHLAVRTKAGLFDVSHMGEVDIDGPDAVRFVNHIFTGDISELPTGHAVYGMMTNELGGVVDDLLVYRKGADSFMLVINAANIDKDIEWIRRHAGAFHVEVRDRCADFGQLALQGPDSEAVMNAALGIDGSGLGFYTFKSLDDGTIVSRTGYTGEDGFEIYASPAVIVAMWDKLMAAGVKPCGLGCRDTLRFEAGLPLYGDELTDDITPLEAGLGMFVSLDKPGGFIGCEALKKQKTEGLRRKLVGLAIEGGATARHGFEVLDLDGAVIGHVTTGYNSLTLGKNIAMALVDARYASLGTALQVRIRRRTVAAEVVKKRFYTPNYKIYYLPSHEYIKVEDNIGLVGISEYAAKQLGTVTYVDMPEEGDDVEKEEVFGAVESRKAASDLFAPVSGEVLEVNDELADNPRLINNAPLEVWIMKVKINDLSDLDALMDEAAYAAYCEGLSH